MCIWDVESGALVRCVVAGQPIAGLAVPPGGDVAHLSVAWNDRGAGRASCCGAYLCNGHLHTFKVEVIIE